MSAPSIQAAEEEDVTPNEDLMREHGALNRVLLIYDDCRRRLEEDRNALSAALAAFVRMDRPHEAREKKALGSGGFENVLGQIVELERRLGLYDLAQFTP